MTDKSKLISDALATTSDSSKKGALKEPLQGSTLDLSSQDTIMLLSQSLEKVLRSSIVPSIESNLQQSLRKSFTSNEFVASLAKEVSKEVSQSLDREVEKAMKKSMLLIENSSFDAIGRSTAILDAKLNQTVGSLDRLSIQDQKIDKLMDMVDSLSRELQTMRASAPAEVAFVNGGQLKTESDSELLQTLLTRGQYEDALSLWISSERQDELFHIVMLFDPVSVCAGLSQMLLLSIIAACSKSLLDQLAQRLVWIEVSLEHLDMSVSFVISRFQALFVQC